MDSIDLTTEQERRLLAGGLPDLVQRRLAELLDVGLTSSFFDARQFAVGVDEGIEAVGQVIGASACRLAVGVVRRTRGPTGPLPRAAPVWHEYDGPIQSWTTARQRALRRLADQAQLLGADAVLGITPSFSTRDAEPTVIEAVFSGTAVKIAGGTGRRVQTPVLGLVSVQEFCLLRRSGVSILGVVGGYSGVGLATSAATRSALAGRWTGVGNTELADLSEAVYEARRLAVSRLRSEAVALRASGVIGVDLARSLGDPAGTRHHMGTTAHLLGTAVRGRPERVDPAPVLRLR